MAIHVLNNLADVIVRSSLRECKENNEKQYKDEFHIFEKSWNTLLRFTASTTQKFTKRIAKILTLKFNPLIEVLQTFVLC